MNEKFLIGTNILYYFLMKENADMIVLTEKLLKCNLLNEVEKKTTINFNVKKNGKCNIKKHN